MDLQLLLGWSTVLVAPLIVAIVDAIASLALRTGTLALAALHHDSHEAYLCDLPSPAKEEAGGRGELRIPGPPIGA